MADRIKLHLRLANLARWEYQQCAADLASSVARLRQLQRHCDALAGEIESLGEEQMKALSAGEFSAERQLAAQRLADQPGGGQAQAAPYRGQVRGAQTQRPTRVCGTRGQRVGGHLHQQFRSQELSRPGAGAAHRRTGPFR